MTDTIKTTLEIGGITMTCIGARCMIGFSYKQGPTPDTYNCKYMKTPLDNSVFDVPFYIECTDDPSKLHKFCEMKYLGLVDNPHYKKIGDLLREMVKKFDGCVVVSVHNEGSCLVTKEKVIRLGCSEGVGEVIGKMLVGLKESHVSHYTAYTRIDSSRLSPVMIWPSSYDKDIRIMCEQLKDVEP